MHPWHDVEIGEHAPSIVNAFKKFPKTLRHNTSLIKKADLLK